VVPRAGVAGDLPPYWTRFSVVSVAMAERSLYCGCIFPSARYAAFAYGAVWALRLGGWNSELVVLVAQRFGLRGMPVWGAFTLWSLFTATAGMIRGMSTALGEEIVGADF